MTKHWFWPFWCGGVFAEKRSELPAEHLSQNPLFIGRCNHSSFENYFLTSEMLAAREGEKTCDVDFAKNLGRGEPCSWLIAASSQMILTDGLLQQDGHHHKPEKVRKQPKWKEKEKAKEKMWQILKWVGDCFKKSEIHGEYQTNFAQRRADAGNSTEGSEAQMWAPICFCHCLKKDGLLLTRRRSRGSQNKFSSC